jgi:hypothetical protein
MYSSKGEAETSFLSLLICKTFIAADWNLCPNLAKTSKSHTVHQNETKGNILNGGYNLHVLEHMDRKEQMDI